MTLMDLTSGFVARRPALGRYGILVNLRGRCIDRRAFRRVIDCRVACYRTIRGCGQRVRQRYQCYTVDMIDTDFRHPKCYASTRGGCSTKISGEHFVSHGLIKLYTFDDPEVRIKHTNGVGIPHPVLPKKFVANVLCEKHNQALSPADAAALKFATGLKTVAEKWLGGNGDWGGEEIIQISGDDFQRWVLKLLITHAAARAVSFNGERLSSPIPPIAIDLLLNRTSWPKSWGLCVAADTRSTHLKFDPFSSIEVITDWWGFTPFLSSEDTAMSGGIVDLAGISFGLSLFDQGDEEFRFRDPSYPLFGSVQRPSSMAWELDGVQKRIEFSWSDPWDHQFVKYVMRR